MPMTFTRFFLLCCLSVIILASCKQKKKASLSGDDPVEVSDFIDFFPKVDLSYQFNDSTLLKKEKDSLLISQKVFRQFIPDSILAKVFGKNAKLKFYPLGKAEVAKGETYLFAKAVAPSKRAAFILAFDNRDSFKAALPAVRSDLPKIMQRFTVIDKSYTITKTQVRKNADGSVSEGKDVYAYNADAGTFLLIMTDALDDRLTELTNPIDTLPRKNKLSADYGSGKMNLVSIRDGRKSDRLSFFIHFEKNGGDCVGELKGEAIIKSPTLAEYRVGGDPCVLQFRFSSAAVTLKEIEGCGSHRGLRCSFDGSFARKREVKPKSSKKRSSGK
jgi:hypothetical protein